MKQDHVESDPRVFQEKSAGTTNKDLRRPCGARLPVIFLVRMSRGENERKQRQKKNCQPTRWRRNECEDDAAARSLHCTLLVLRRHEGAPCDELPEKPIT
jgi:hypothetical protein